MAHFIADIQGSRGPASRLGGRHISSHTRGWNAGVRVSGNTVGVNGEGGDAFHVYATGGSNGSGSERYIAIVREASDGYKVAFPGVADAIEQLRAEVDGNMPGEQAYRDGIAYALDTLEERLAR